MRHVGTELDVLAYRRTELLVVRESRFIECVEVDVDEALPLFVGNLQSAVHIDGVLKPQAAGEPVGAAEGLGREPREVIDMGRLPDRR